MGLHEINCHIAYLSRDPDNELAMALAAFYARVRDFMLEDRGIDLNADSDPAEGEAA